MPVRWVLFALGSAAILVVSWGSLPNPRSHGFWRFFVFESLLGLILVVAPGWFANPFAARQIVSWLLLSASLILAVWGFALLGGAGRPRGGVERTTVLVTTGVYRYVRHPLYSSLLLLTWGALLKAPFQTAAIPAAVLAISLASIATVALLLTAKAEEAENLAKFGEPYRRYMRATKRFIPFILVVTVVGLPCLL